MKEFLIMTTVKNCIVSLFLFTAFSSLNLATAKVEVVLGNLTLEENPNLPFKAPQTIESEIILSREQYIVSYNKFKRTPNWVAWKLEADNLGSSGRSNDFNIDSDLENYFRVNSKNFSAVAHTEYKGSCFDRGHQTPSADRTDTKENNSATFLMSNMTPQTPYLNRIIWAHLEQYTRDLVQKQGKKAYIIAGPVYDQNFGSIGPKKDIHVPSKQFKIIYLLDAHEEPGDINTNTEVITVLMPNTLEDGTKPLEDTTALCKPLVPGKSDKNDWMKYKTTIANVEKITGLIFKSKPVAK